MYTCKYLLLCLSLKFLQAHGRACSILLSIHFRYWTVFAVKAYPKGGQGDEVLPTHYHLEAVACCLA